jgi:fructokinase
MFLGGAPLNVAYHLSRLGLKAVPVSAVGGDFLGNEARRRIESWGVSTRYVTRLPHLPTGTVRATLDGSGSASYRFAAGVAWDRIQVSRSLIRARAPDAVLIGTLALREEPNRRALQRLWDAWPQALRVVDLNLRAPFDRPAAIALALKTAQLLKLNDDELGRLTATRVRTSAQRERAARSLADEHRIERVCVTAGAAGAGLLWDKDWFWEEARPVDVVDTVGAGDAFLAGFLAAILDRRQSPALALRAASRLGEFVAASDGATPPYRGDASGRPHQT